MHNEKRARLYTMFGDGPPFGREELPLAYSR